jgi:N,N'-diacetyllegionaminate synthase
MNTEVIAEIGWNFLGDLKLASRMIVEAKKAGADTAKFQLWNPKTLKSGSWDLDGRRQIYEKAALSDESVVFLIEQCEELSLKSLFSVFTINDAQRLATLNIESVKLPSHESYNIDLHEFCAGEFTSIYASMGACSEEEFTAVADIYSSYRGYVCGMHCVSSYPLDVAKSNLCRLTWIKEAFDHVGYSDHTKSTVVPALAVAQGASVIEKHFTVSNSLPGRDNQFALEPEGFQLMVENIRLAEQALEFHGRGFQECEKDTVDNYRGRWGA